MFRFYSNCKSENTYGKVINCASNFEISIGDTAKLIAEVMNAEVDIISENERIRPKYSEVNRLYGDNKLLKNITNWEPNNIGLNGFKKGLKKTAVWFSNKDNLAFYKINTYAI